MGNRAIYKIIEHGETPAFLLIGEQTPCHRCFVFRRPRQFNKAKKTFRIRLHISLRI